MRFALAFLILVLVAVVNAQQVAPKNDERSFFGTTFSFTTFTLIKSTTTSVSSLTSTITCTTSTATLTTCTAGRRRRGLFYDESAGTNIRARRGLFFTEEAQDTLVSSPEKSSSDPVSEVLPAKTPAVDNNDLVIPLELQSGFVLPEGIEDNRFLLAFGTSTVTSYTITTTTTSLTATCSSITNFPTCSSG